MIVGSCLCCGAASVKFSRSYFLLIFYGLHISVQALVDGGRGTMASVYRHGEWGHHQHARKLYIVSFCQSSMVLHISVPACSVWYFFVNYLWFAHLIYGLCIWSTDFTVNSFCQSSMVLHISFPACSVWYYSSHPQPILYNIILSIIHCLHITAQVCSLWHYSVNYLWFAHLSPSLFCMILLISSSAYSV